MDALYMESRKALSTCVLPDADALIGRNAAEDASRQEQLIYGLVLALWRGFCGRSRTCSCM